MSILRILTTLLLVCAISNVSFAKYETKKYTKDIVYEGNLEKKRPFGEGKLCIHLSKQYSPLIIKGNFRENTILNGTYSNYVIQKTERDETLVQVFTFDSLQYTINKKENILSMRAYGLKFSDNIKVSIQYIDIIYRLVNNKWTPTYTPNDFDFQVYGRDSNFGDFSYQYRAGFEKSKAISKNRTTWNNNITSTNSFVPIVRSGYSLSDICRPTTINYNNGGIVHYDGTRFTSKWGNSTATGEYKNGKLSILNIYLNNSKITDSNLCIDDDYNGIWKGKIVFSDGSKFIGTIKNLIPGKFALNLLNPNMTISNDHFYFGDLFTPDNYRIHCDNNLGLDKDDLLASRIKAYKVKSPGYSEAPYVTHRLANNNVVEDNRETLRDFANRGTDSNKGYGQADLNNLFADEYCYHEPVNFNFNETTGTLTFKGFAQKTYSNPDPKEFFVAIDDHLCLSYPKSRISLHHGKNYFDEPRSVPTLETVNIPKETFKRIQSTKCDILWVFKIEKFGHYELFGKTVRIYVIDHDTHEILADLSESLSTNRGSFKKESHEVYKEKKKTYHKHGRVETCGPCLGTGMGLQGGTCPFCGGKGWYVEHYW